MLGADEADAASTLEVEGGKGSQDDAAEDQLTTARAEKGVSGVVLGGGVMAQPVVESSVRDAEQIGMVTLRGVIGIGEVVKGVGDVSTRPTERVLAGGASSSRLIGRHGSFPWVVS